MVYGRTFTFCGVRVFHAVIAALKRQAIQPLAAKLKGSVGEGPNQTNGSEFGQGSVKIL